MTRRETIDLPCRDDVAVQRYVRGRRVASGARLPGGRSLARVSSIAHPSAARTVRITSPIPLSLIRSMFTGEQVASLFAELGVTHAVTVPDSTLGQWQGAIVERGDTRLLRVCREGEAWGIAAGLWLGGATPVVMIQCTGLFESGDALRNVLHDWKLPIFSVVGYRSYLNQENLPGDTCLVFTEPILDAWRIDYRLITEPGQLDSIAEHYHRCRAEGRPGAALIAEGRS